MLLVWRIPETTARNLLPVNQGAPIANYHDVLCPLPIAALLEHVQGNYNVNHTVVHMVVSIMNKILTLFSKS